MKDLGQDSLTLLQHSVIIIENNIKRSKYYMVASAILSIISLVSVLIISVVFYMTYNGNIVSKSKEVVADVIDCSAEVYAIQDDEVADLNDVKTKLVHAGRFDEIPSNTKYDRWGLPVDRKWLTSSEWQGEHLTGGSVEKSIFKTWKSIHMNGFIKYVKKAAQEEIKVGKYNKIPEELIAAQAILESGFGVSRIAVNANNLFGHKCYDCTDPGDYIVAHDDHVDDRFHVKKDKWESIRSHSKLLMRKYYPRIPKSRRDNPDIKDWLNALCGCGTELSVDKAKKAHDKGNFSYATSCYTGKDGYAKKIMKYIKQYNLDE